ncbi:hypothetical protein PENANT_c070G04590 [Penicillium antarcticum]|uniref:Uncharacterized protein n=1 Tax=Penicillium antarcticum TaxID=416450 RepID=A0A1V6PPL7_9EURO|nr:hypothetical protein PENANT_c070G04590 [Penicillium antarcticum]
MTGVQPRKTGAEGPTRRHKQTKVANLFGTEELSHRDASY